MNLLVAAMLVTVIGAGSPGTPSATRCRIDQMELATGGFVSEKTQQHTATVRLTNRLRGPCVLHGYPTIALLDDAGHELPFVYRRRGDQMITNARPETVTVGPGGSAFFGFNKDACVTRAERVARTLLVSLPGSAERRPLTIQPFRIDYCGAGVFGVIRVSPFERRLERVFARTP